MVKDNIFGNNAELSCSKDDGGVAESVNIDSKHFLSSSTTLVSIFKDIKFYLVTFLLISF
jgi:hypothetical protein